MIIKLNNKTEEPEVNVDELQKETIETLKEYVSNLIPKLSEMVNELRGELMEDTFEYLRMMIDGFNWVIEAYNATSNVINKDKIIDNAAVDTAVKELGDAYNAKDAVKIADVLQDKIIPFLTTLRDAI